MTRRVACKTETISHGGEILTGSPDTFEEGLPVARVGDRVRCDIHGNQTITTGSQTCLTNGRATARIGESISCGAIITSGRKLRGIGDTIGSFTPDQSKLFTRPPDSAVRMNHATEKANEAKHQTYLEHPEKFKNPVAKENGTKENYAGTPDTTGLVDNEPPKKCESGHPASVIPFLQKCLGEAANGTWRETGQGGHPSNPNIIGIWKSLGFPSSGIWTSDQTAWCAGFVNFALKESGLAYLKEAGAKQTISRAVSELQYTKIAIADMQPGDIVLWSYSHVNFCYTAKNGHFTFVGGNQTPDDKTKTNNPSDGSVTISWKSGWTTAKGQIVAVIRPKC